MTPYSFEVLDTGPLTLIQDQGRSGHQHLGITEGGVMDTLSARWANRLCGNAIDAAVLEITFGRLTIKANQPFSLSVTGAQAPLKINGVYRELWATHHAHPDDIIEIGQPIEGVRSYLAVSGGLLTETYLNSAATTTREQLGPNNGKAMTRGLQLCCDNRHTGRYRVPLRERPRLKTFQALQLVTGYQFQLLERQPYRTLVKSRYQLTPSCDRLGYRLKGPAVQFDLEQFYSEGICLGAVQITPEGQPIVMMSDHQTIGGYPKVGAITRQSLNQLSQMRPGETIQFLETSAEQALQERRKNEERVENVPLEPIEF